MLKIPLPSPSKLGWLRGREEGQPEGIPRPGEASLPQLGLHWQGLARLGTQGGDSSRRASRSRASAVSEPLG